MSSGILVKDKESLEVFTLLFDFGQEKKLFESIRVSHFWSEKISILLQFIQLFSLAFTSNYESWPNRWQGMYKSSHLSLFAGDLGVLYFDEVYSSSENRLLYAGGWVLTCFILLSLYFSITYLLPLKAYAKVHLQKICFKLLHFMYLPIALGLLPVALCQYNNCSVDVDQLAVSLMSILVIVFYLLGYPLYLVHHAYSSVVSTETEAYNEFIRLKEIEFLLGVSSSWLTERLYLFSSFRGSKLRVFHRAVYCFFVLFLVVIHAASNTSNSVKLLVLLCSCGLFSLYVSIFPVYRCLTSSCLYMLCLWIVTCNFFLGYLRASDYNSQTMVDSNLVNLLVAINLTGFVLIVIFIAAVVGLKVRWDVDVATVKQLAIGYRYLLADLRNAQKMILTLRTFNNFFFIRPEPLEKMAAILSDHYELLSLESHPLQYTIIEQLDILSYLLELVNSQTLLKKSKNLLRDYDLLVRVIKRRSREQILLNPTKRRIILKLGVLKMFLKDRTTKPFNSGDPTDYMEKKSNNESGLDLSKFYKNFEEIDSSRELIDTKKNVLDEIDCAAEERDFVELVKITQKEVSNQNETVLKYLKKIWEEIGLEKLPKELNRVIANA